MTFRINGTARTDVGCVRGLNEDSIFADADRGVWAVADGMGGHAHGDWASAHIVGRLGGVAGDTLDTRLDALVAAILGANDGILAESATRGAQMGSTVVALVLADDRFAVAWAGDSRAYLRREGTLYRLTVDHTQVQDMLDRQLLTPAEAEDHPMAHVLSRAVGVDPGLTLDIVTDSVQAGDMFLLCSDGLTNIVSDDEIGGALAANAVEAAPALLIALARERGAPDNVSIATVEVREMTVLNFGVADGTVA